MSCWHVLSPWLCFSSQEESDESEEKEGGACDGRERLRGELGSWGAGKPSGA